jgi:hypothetical protein
MESSKACQANMHANCHDWDGCGCQCHKVCERCGSQCRNRWRATDQRFICATCLKGDLEKFKRGIPCQRCGKGMAYRHPGTGDDRFMCRDCHVELGHPNYYKLEKGGK